MRTALTLLALTLGGVLPASALTLDLPVRRPGAAQRIAAPAYAGDVLILQLRSEAAARAFATRQARAARGFATGDEPVSTLDVAAVDAVASRLGGATFDPQFRGESPPVPGSDAPDFTSFYVVRLPAGAALEDALDSFRALPEVASADPVAVLPVSFVPNDSLFASSWWLYQASRRDIHAPEAWDFISGDTAIVVAVLDTGVLPWHPDIGGTTAGLPGQMWTNRAEAAGMPGVDDDANGFVDDVRGWDFVHETDPLNVAPGEDGRDPDNDPNDYAGHGTAVAGLIGALTDNGIGMSGVAWRTRLMPLRMGWAYGGSSGLGAEVRMDFAAAAIRYATRMGASVINCSWESAFDPALAAAVGAAVRAGVTVVSAAGNNTGNIYLSTRDDVISVAATTATDAISAISNRGDYIDLAAPGEGLTSTTILRNLAGDSLTLRRPHYGTITGTSASAPLVSAVAALIQARDLRAGRRALTPRGIQLRVMESADDIAAENPALAGQYGSGRLNAQRAVLDPTSAAWRTRSHNAGPLVVIPAALGNPRIAFVTLNRRLLILDGATGDTLVNQAITGAPTLGGIAAAPIGAAIGLFFATEDGEVHGFDHTGAMLPGWPQPAARFGAESGVALADITGDEQVEVIAGAQDGSVWTWDLAGNLVTGFPATVPAPIEMPVAAHPFGATGACDIVVAAGGELHVLRGDGTGRAGFPVPLPGGLERAPVVSQESIVVVTAGNMLHAFDQAGVAAPGFPVALAGVAGQDPALADMDGDGDDEIVIATRAPAMVEVRQGNGASLSAQNWPRALFANPDGPPVIGAGLSSPTAPLFLLVRRGGRVLALSPQADSLPVFPKPGNAGAWMTVTNAQRVLGISGSLRAPPVHLVAGTGTDSLLYVYAMGTMSDQPPFRRPWPTARGNHARTASRFPVETSIAIDDRPALPIADLRGSPIRDSDARLVWTTPEDFESALLAYDLRRSATPILSATFAAAIPVPVGAPGAAGSLDSATVSTLPPGTWYFAIKSRDAWGNVSAMSNVAAVTIGTPGPAGIALSVVEQPARSIALFDWRAAPDGQGGAQSIHIHDLNGRRLRVLELGPGAGGRVQWDGRDARSRRVPAGLYYARLISGSLHTQTRLVLLP